MKGISAKILFFIVIFVVGFSVWYSPIIFKGHAPYKMVELMPLAKNIHETGLYSLENNKNVFLASSEIKENGQIATVGNKFTAYLYAGLFETTGVLNPNELILVSIILNCLTLLIFAFIVFYLFGFRIAGLFSFIYILLPFNWFSVYSLGTYEFAVFFLSLFFLFFILGRGKKYQWTFLFAAGIFLVLSALAREALLLLIPILFVYLWFSEKRKLIIPIFIPVILIISAFYLPSFFTKSTYINLFIERNNAEQRFTDSSFYEHLYPDPYVYHFEKQEFLNVYNEKINQASFLESLQMKKVLANTGERGMRFYERFLLGIVLLPTHLSRFVSLEFVGGPFILFFTLLGLFHLKDKDGELYKFFIYWVLGVVILLSFVVLVSRSHLKDFNWLIPFLTALGVFSLSKLFKKNLLFAVFLSIILLYNLVLVNHVLFGKIYDDNKVLKIEAYAQQIEKSDVPDNKVIALGLNVKEEIILNYLTDKSMVVLVPNTINKLIEQNKLKDAFEYFNVKYILGYSDDLSAQILSQTEITNITSNSIKINLPQTSPLKSFFMNLVR